MWRRVFNHNAPLWFYILREAEQTKHNGIAALKGRCHLGSVGGRIVAEVLVGLAYHDKHSLLWQTPQWQPQPPVARQGEAFDMTRLIEFTDQHFC